ncbi:MAG: fibronectin type III domain-containing protein [Candidatus Hydrogenedentota bacterium]
MKIVGTRWVLTLSAVMLLCFGGVAGSSPRILVTEERLERIQRGLEDPDSHYAQAFELLRQRVESEDIQRFGATETNWNYARSYLAQAAAFCHQVTGDAEYADIAYRTLRDIHDDPDPDERLPESGAHGLSRATVGLGFALAYDWCHDAWGEGQRQYILERVEAAFEMWEDFSHTNLGHERKSNWVAVCRGAELMMILGVRQEDERAERYAMLQDELRRHIENGYDEIGASQEGLGYVGYGGIFLLPAVFAARDVGDTMLWEAIEDDRSFHRHMMYAGSFASAPEGGVLEHLKMFPASGVGGPNINDEGFASLVLGAAPEEDLPEALWWYDRHMGRLAEPRDAPELHYEPRRQGTMWALLLYPDGVDPRDPTGEWPSLVSDGQGRHYFRNRWRDVNDVLVAVHADTKWLPAAWSQAEAGHLSLIAYDTYFFGGPRKEREGELYTKLLVDGDPGQSTDTGERQRLEKFNRGGYLVIDGGQQYANLGVDNYQRHVMLEYGSPEDNNAVVAVLDQVDSIDEHTYTWNANLGTEKRLADWGIEAEAGQDQGYPAFTLRGAGEGVVKGWVLSPEGIEVHADDERLYFEEEASSSEFLVVMSVEPVEPATLEVKQEGPRGLVFQVGQTLVGYDRAKSELHYGEKAEELAVAADQPLPVRGLRTRTLSDQAVELRWFEEDWNADRLVLEQRRQGEESFEAVAELDAERAMHVVKGLEPSSAYSWRLVAAKPQARAEPSPEVSASTWERGYAVHVEDFAPREGDELPENTLGEWQTRNQDRGWALSEAQGSPRNAEAPEGKMATTGRTRIDNTNIFFTEGFEADLSGEAAAVEIDVRTEGTVRFGLMLKLSDGRWARTVDMAHIASRDRWETQRWEIANIDEWVEIDPDELSTGDKTELSSAGLTEVEGVGIWANWPLNERWAQVDQLHVYVRGFERLR